MIWVVSLIDTSSMKASIIKQNSHYRNNIYYSDKYILYANVYKTLERKSHQKFLHWSVFVNLTHRYKVSYWMYSFIKPVKRKKKWIGKLFQTCLTNNHLVILYIDHFKKLP